MDEGLQNKIKEVDSAREAERALEGALQDEQFSALCDKILEVVNNAGAA